ncbi:unnamed protein product [Strongylus vulgaris]|uniref:Uncharacterized protein n=1 Tax=Strongylus vulgaris TaxID=40348 RepID=A0A3P7IZ01_STRVU|nr:unnamed protein product [Strongylus vulgaris]
MDDREQIEAFWESAKTNSTDFIQFDDPAAPLSAVIKSFSDMIASDNQQPATVMQKKQVVLLTDYMPLNVTAALNSITCVKENEQKLALVHELNVTEFEQFITFPVFSVTDDINITEAEQIFQQPLDFVFPQAIYQGKPGWRDYLFMMSFDAKTVTAVLQNTASGDMCNLPNNKMYRDFLIVQFAHSGIAMNFTLPFVGHRTESFSQHCIEYMELQFSPPHFLDLLKD